MAVYFLNTKVFGRSNGGSAPSAAAYRAGERIRDERTGRIYDHTDRRDVLHKEILVPTRLADADLSWAKDRATLWNAAEAAETRKNARVAREYLVALPSELDAGRRVALARGFAQELADRYRFAVDVAVHAPRDFPGSDPRNFHAHLLATTREVGAEELGPKTRFELGESSRRALGLGPSIEELLLVRERWATVTNEALREANVAARVDHRTLREQGIDREPKLWIPRVAYEVERRGYYSPVAESIRSSHEARMHSSRERHADQAANEQRSPPSLEDMQRQACENWLRMRRELADKSHESAADADASRKSPGRDYDLGL